MNLEEFQKWMKSRLTWQIVMTAMILATIGVIELILWAGKSKSSSPPSSSNRKVAYALAEDKKTISPTFARCSYFKVVENGKTIKIVENPYKGAMPAGIPAAEFVKSLGACEVVAGSFGPNAERKLKELGVKPRVSA